MNTREMYIQNKVIELFNEYLNALKNVDTQTIN